ncbi:MAG: single-stranded-DNA-specific exonuclease RecJ [Peptococcaceae bacterium]|nr:single-stranded-DNA-specific exonuclease RecJ [Peptococcaceae bacterium]
MREDNLRCLIQPDDQLLQKLIARECGISEFLSHLLIVRGIRSSADARLFLEGTLKDLYPPYLLRDLSEAVNRIKKAISKKQNILIYGDHDVDGMSATALLIRAFKLLGVDVKYYIPEREDGYGLHWPVIEQASDEGINLIITVDCGINAVQEVAGAKARSIDIIVTDHHQPQAEMPQTLVINPKRADCLYPFKDLAGVGVAAKLAAALLDEYDIPFPDDLVVLCCLGTIADIVPLTGENRIIVRHGIPQLKSIVGVAALADAIGFKDNPTVRDIACQLVPVINAAGRMGRVKLGVDLLVSDDTYEVKILAEELIDLNRRRQDLEAQVLTEALAEIGSWTQPPLIPVLHGETWHPGVVGIVASKLAKKLGRPVMVMAGTEDEVRGSARSIPGFNIFEALEIHRELLIEFGGHPQAAGFSLAAKDIPEIAKAINEYAASQESIKRETETEYIIDAVLPLGKLSPELVHDIDRLAPFGTGNPEPLFLAQNVKFNGYREVGKNKEHLQVQLRQNSYFVKGIGFNMAADREAMEESKELDLIYAPILNQWNGRCSVELKLYRWTKGGSAKCFTYPSGPFDTLRDEFLQLLETEPFILPDSLRWDLSGQEPVEYTYPINHSGLLADCRRLRHKDIIRRYINRNQRVLVITTNPEQVVELFLMLNKEQPEDAGDISYLHPAMDKEKHGRIVETFKNGAVKTLIATPLHDIQLNPEIVIVSSPLYTWADWCWVASLGAKLTVMCFGENEYRLNRRRLNSLAPNRTIMAYIYTSLKNMGPRTAAIDTEKFAHYLRRLGFRETGSWTVQVALRILQELGFISFEVTGGIYYTTVSHVKEKKFLPQSNTFVKVHSFKKSSARCQKFFLEATPGDLALYFNCDILSWGAGYAL